MFGGKARLVRYALVSIASGLLFGIMDGLINANPLAETLYESNLIEYLDRRQTLPSRTEITRPVGSLHVTHFSHPGKCSMMLDDASNKALKFLNLLRLDPEIQTST